MGGLNSGGNATATAEEADEVMDKFLADAEMELSNPVLITGVDISLKRIHLHPLCKT